MSLFELPVLAVVNVWNALVSSPAPAPITPMLLPDWMDPQALILALGNWALWGVLLIVFAECAIFPVLPGDSLLFTVGMFIAMDPPSITFPGMSQPMVLVISCILLTIAAVAGNIAGYFVGVFIGPKLFKPRTGFWGKVFDPKHVDETHAFYEKYGAKALVLARFVPFVRTFVTIIAGIGKMNFRTFITWTALGGILWAIGVTLLGYFLGNVPFVQKNIEVVLLLIVFVSILPMIVEYLNALRKNRSANNKN